MPQPKEVRPALGASAKVSPMVLGRLLKADVVLSGHLEDSSTMVNDQPGSATTLKLQLIDLINVNVLAEEKTEYFNDFGGIGVFFPVLFTEPNQVTACVPSFQSKEPDAALQKLQSMTRDEVVAEVRKVQAAELDKAVAVARKLLASGLAERHAAVATTQLVPMFFADVGTGGNLGDWKAQWQATLREESAAQHEALLDTLFPLLVEKLPVVAERLDEAKVPPSQRRFLAQRPTTVLASDVKPRVASAIPRRRPQADSTRRGPHPKLSEVDG